MKTIYKERCRSLGVVRMSRKGVLKELMLILGIVLLILTVFEYLVWVFSLTIDPTLSYWIQMVYLVLIFVFLVLLFLSLNPESPKNDMS